MHIPLSLPLRHAIFLASPPHLLVSDFYHPLTCVSPSHDLCITDAMWHAGLLHNDGSDSVTVHAGVILHALMILDVIQQQRPAS